MTLLQATDVVVTYGATTALAGATIDVERGRSLALTGPSGAGKSTLLSCLAGLIRPSAGVVTFEGTDLATLRPDDLAALRLHRFGFVHQGGELMPELTLVENVEMPLRLAGIRGGAARRAATDLLEGLGVGPAAGRFPHEVSGGQAQRAAVARAVVHGPDVVFADEPTGALDSANGAAVMDLLLHAATEAGSTLVMVTHDLALAGMLDETVEIRDGVVRDRTAGMRA